MRITFAPFEFIYYFSEMRIRSYNILYQLWASRRGIINDMTSDSTDSKKKKFTSPSVKSYKIVTNWMLTCSIRIRTHVYKDVSYDYALKSHTVYFLFRFADDLCWSGIISSPNYGSPTQVGHTYITCILHMKATWPNFENYSYRDDNICTTCIYILLFRNENLVI